ncbi:11152_t:CDS:2 [Diversispora eburnea]|uniref:cystathionine gamma-synthase n=1 Tax=Diversispora eburnea TaxID=1213867 RepID=A0A9N8VCX8_9GLOM|nr:11152_t:CDS:2 [Diversispora eburnea]
MYIPTDTAEIGDPIPANTPHAISVNLPTWQDNIDYEEARERVISRMSNGYPRFFIHNQIKKLMSICEQKFAKETESCLLFPSHKTAHCCRIYIRKYYSSEKFVSPVCIRLAELTVVPLDEIISTSFHESVTLHVVLFPKDAFPIAKSFWQHTGVGISSRLAEYALGLMQAKQDEEEQYTKIPAKRRSSFKIRYCNPQISNSKRISPTDITFSEHSEKVEENCYVEERYGRNLPILFANKAKIALKRRIAGVLGIEKNGNNLDEIISRPINANERGIEGITENDVYLFPTGMSSIFHAHQLLLKAFQQKKSICFGFPYIDTLKILEKFGPGCHFFGNGSFEDIDAIENLLISGEQILALFCEFPSNPLCKSSDLKRLRKLADKYNFLIVIDETIGNFVNVEVLNWADIMVSSLSKIFSGDSNVMGGSMVLNPQRRYYDTLKKVIDIEYEDLLWREDAIVLERNSRTFRERILKINENTEEIYELLRKSSKGGYGGLFSITFYSDSASQQFFDALSIAKGPSLGTNFTLACPYTILAHYLELDWASKYGVESGLVRVSVGLEDKEILLKAFQNALDSISDE